MHPSVPLLVFSTLLSFTTYFYFFGTPDTIAVDRTKAARPALRPSYWGPVDSDFDWCEENNVYSPYVSELFNSATSAFYPLGSLYAWTVHSHLELSKWHLLMLWVNAIMGTGSVLFHGSLRYHTQLLDELPLYAMAILAAAALRQRSARAAGIQPLVAAWAVVLAAVLLLSDRNSGLHHTFRGLMTVSFSIAFVFIFTVGAVAAREVDTFRATYTKDAATATDLFQWAFLSFVAAIVCWVLDIVACHELHALPAGLPYPHLHAFGWHLGTCLGLLQVFALLVLHERTVRDGRAARLVWGSGFLVSLVPRVVGAASDKVSKGT